MAAPLPEVTDILREVLRDSGLEIAPATRFDDLTDWDSMDLITIIVEVECRFDLEFELPEIDRIITVNDLLQFIVNKQAVAAA